MPYGRRKSSQDEIQRSYLALEKRVPRVEVVLFFVNAIDLHVFRTVRSTGGVRR